MKKIVIWFMLLVLTFFCVACNEQVDTNVPEQPAEQTTDVETGIYTSGTYTGKAMGFGGEINVTINVDKDNIVSVEAKGDSETEGIGSKALELLPDRIREAQSAEIDTISGATLSSKALLVATKDALAQARGEMDNAANVTMSAGTYTGYGTGFSIVEKLPVDVKVSETEIIEIKVAEDNAETAPILQTVIDYMIPKIIEKQTIGIDSITGATVSSSAVKEAVEDALVKALEAGGSDVSSISKFNKVLDKKPVKTQTIDVDVVVVGMGGAGTAAAMRTAELQAENGEVSVLAIEKTARFGGTSALTTQTMAINPKQLAIDINGGKDFVNEDEVIEARNNSFSGVAKDSKLDPFWEIYLNYSGDVLDWQIDHGFEFGQPDEGFFGDGQAVVFDYGGKVGANKAEIATYFDRMVADYEALGGKYMLQTEGYELIYDEETKDVKGIKARSMVDGTEYIINAKAVISSTGGFGGNSDLVRSYNSNGCAYRILGSVQNDGKMIKSAWNLNAGRYGDETGMNVHNAAPTVILDEFEVVSVEGKDYWTGRPGTYSINDIPLFLITNKDTLFVDGSGNRYADEAGMWPWWQGGEQYYSITSESRLNEIMENGFTHTNTGLFKNYGYQAFPLNTPVPEMFDVIEAGIKAGCIVKGDTPEELAEALGFNDFSILTDTIKEYNEYCETGVDEQYGKTAEFLCSIGDEGPYYAVIGEAWNYSSSGGLYINGEFNVLEADEKTPISGLYATGTDVLGFVPSAFGGDAQAWSYISGYFAAENVNEYIRE